MPRFQIHYSRRSTFPMSDTSATIRLDWPSWTYHDTAGMDRKLPAVLPTRALAEAAVAEHGPAFAHHNSGYALGVVEDKTREYGAEGTQEGNWWRHKSVARVRALNVVLPWAREAWWTVTTDARRWHFAHVAKESDKVAFIENDIKGVAQIYTAISPGRYLTRYFPELGGDAIKAWAEAFNKMQVHSGLKFAETGKEMIHVYDHGPSSCMGKGHEVFYNNYHPVQLYAAGDLTLAYLERGDGIISARALVWAAKKRFGRIYGDEARLRGLLEREGFFDVWKGSHESHGFTGARLVKKQAKREGQKILYYAPYVDGNRWAKREGGFLVLDPKGAVGVHGVRGVIHDWVTECAVCKEIPHPRVDPKTGEQAYYNAPELGGLVCKPCWKAAGYIRCVGCNNAHPKGTKLVAVIVKPANAARGAVAAMMDLCPDCIKYYSFHCANCAGQFSTRHISYQMTDLGQLWARTITKDGDLARPNKLVLCRTCLEHSAPYGTAETARANGINFFYSSPCGSYVDGRQSQVCRCQYCTEERARKAARELAAQKKSSNPTASPVDEPPPSAPQSEPQALNERGFNAELAYYSNYETNGELPPAYRAWRMDTTIDERETVRRQVYEIWGYTPPPIPRLDTAGWWEAQAVRHWVETARPELRWPGPLGVTVTPLPEGATPAPVAGPEGQYIGQVPSVGFEVLLTTPTNATFTAQGGDGGGFAPAPRLTAAEIIRQQEYMRLLQQLEAVPPPIWNPQPPTAAQPEAAQQATTEEQPDND